MVSSIKILVELFAYLFCLAGLFGKKFKLSIHAVVLIILDLFLLTGINEYEFPEYLVSLIYIGMFVYGLLCYKENIKHTLVNCFLSAVIVTVIQIIFCFPMYFLVIIGCRLDKTYELWINIGCLVTIIFITLKFNLVRISQFILKRNILFYILIFILLSIFGKNFFIMKKNNMMLGADYVQIIYFLFILLFTIYEWQKSRMDAEKKKMQLEMNKLYYDAYDQLIMLVRERQHDMKNHINAILSMIHTTDSYDELVAKQQEYCGYVIKQNEETKLLLSSGNPLITGFLYSKKQEAERRGITIECKIGIEKEIAFPEYELVEIMGILLDNAMEVLEKGKMKKKKIYVSLKEREDELVLIVANTSIKYEETVIDRFFETGYSSKGENRGIGLSKLKRLVNERKGEIIVSNEQYQNDNYLQFELIIPKI